MKIAWSTLPEFGEFLELSRLELELLHSFHFGEDPVIRVADPLGLWVGFHPVDIDTVRILILKIGRGYKLGRKRSS